MCPQCRCPSPLKIKCQLFVSGCLRHLPLSPCREFGTRLYALPMRSKGTTLCLKYSCCWKQLPLYPDTFIQYFHVTVNDILMGCMRHGLENAFPLLPGEQPMSLAMFLPLLRYLLALQPPLSPAHADAELGSLPPGHPSQGCWSTESRQDPHWGDVGDSPQGGRRAATLPAGPPMPATARWRRWLLCLMQSLTWTALGTETQPKPCGGGGPAKRALPQSPPEKTLRCC